jgi:D-psicose/D-tagatose/L-ribulose 3-epimerase
MRLAISNIAWDISEDEDIANMLNRYCIDAIDIAPGKYFPDPVKATDEDIARLKQWWAARGIEITGMQALLFGTVGLNVFGPLEVRDALLQHLTAVCRIGAGLGATRIVLGSPKNRDRTGLSDEDVQVISVPFFRRLGDIAQSHGVMICLEPNPPCYGANFMTTSDETAEVVRQVAHPAIRMQLDTGAITINGEDPVAALENYASLIGHVHASEPEIAPLGDKGTDHAMIAACLRRHLPESIVSIEMLATKNEPHLVAIKRALKVAIRFYRNVGDGVEI